MAFYDSFDKYCQLLFIVTPKRLQTCIDYLYGRQTDSFTDQIENWAIRLVFPFTC